MATIIDLNSRVHRLVASLSGLRTELLDDDDDDSDLQQRPSSPPLLPIAIDDLERGLDDARFLALVSDYLAGLRGAHSRLRMEHQLVCDELTYVRGQLVGAIERTVELEAAAARHQPSCVVCAVAADPLGEELRFDGRHDAEVFGGVASDGECDGDDDDDDVAGGEATADLEQSQTMKTTAAPPPSPANPLQLLPIGDLLVDNSGIHEHHPQITHRQNDDANDDDAVLDVAPPTDLLRTRLVTNHFARYLNAGDFELATATCQRMLTDLHHLPNDDNDDDDDISTSTTTTTNSSTSTASASESRDMAAALEVLALADVAHSRWPAAAQRMRRVLAIHDRTLDAAHPSLTAALNTLAHVYGKCGQPQRARPLCERALRLRRAACGPRHRSVARQHYNVAVVEQQCGAAGAALEHYGRALEIYEATHSVDASDATRPGDEGRLQQTVETIRERMAGILLQQGRLAEAAAVYKAWLAPTMRVGLPPAAAGGGEGGGSGSGGVMAYETSGVCVRSPHHTPSVRRMRAMRPIWEVAEEIERMCTAAGGTRRPSLESYELRCDYRQWYDSVRVHFPGACAALKRLAFVYRRMGMHYAAKMLEHCCTLQRRKRTLRFGGNGDGNGEGSPRTPQTPKTRQ